MRETKSKPSKFLLSSVKFVSALIDWEKLSHNVFGVFFSLFSVSLCTKTAAAIYHQIIKLTPFLSSPFPLFVASSSISLPLFRTIHSRRGLCGVYSHSTWQNTTAAAASIFSLSLSHTLCIFSPCWLRRFYSPARPVHFCLLKVKHPSRVWRCTVWCEFKLFRGVCRFCVEFFVCFCSRVARKKTITVTL